MSPTVRPTPRRPRPPPLPYAPRFPVDGTAAASAPVGPYRSASATGRACVRRPRRRWTAPGRPSPTTSVPVVSIPTASLDAKPGRRDPPGAPAAAAPRVRAPRTTRLNEESPNANVGGTGGRNMQLAWGSGILLGVVALLCAHFGSVSSMVLITIVVLFAAAEAFAAFRGARYHPATLLGLVAILSLMIETYNKGVAALPARPGHAGGGHVRLVPGPRGAGGRPGRRPLLHHLRRGLGRWLRLLRRAAAQSRPCSPHRHGVAFLLAAVIVTVAADVASLLVGSAFGRHPLAPSVSPNKTWEGFLGGAVASVLVAVIVVHFIHPWTIGKALVLGIVVAVVAPLGDLSQSMIKRHLGVKDMGRLMPGHGGILDRVDGLLFVLPATYFVVKAFHLG